MASVISTNPSTNFIISFLYATAAPKAIPTPIAVIGFANIANVVRITAALKTKNVALNAFIPTASLPTPTMAPPITLAPMNTPNAILIVSRLSFTNNNVAPTFLPNALAKFSLPSLASIMDLVISVNAAVSPPSPTSSANMAISSCRFENAPVNVCACLSIPPAKSVLPMFSITSIMSKPLFLISVVVPLKITFNLSPSVFTLIPSCLSISNSPVVALNTALATSSILLPIPAAMLPTLVIKSTVGSRPAFLNVINALVTS